MNEIYNTLHRHASVRSYNSDSVKPEILNRIIEAATRASTSGNMQAYSIIVTQDAAIKRELLAPHFNQSMVTEAPVLMTFCADFNRMKKWLNLCEAPQNFDNFMSFMIAAIDAVLASQNAVLAAESEGLGVCYMGTTLASCDEIGKILNCPANVIPVVGFSLGYSNEIPVPRDRLPLRAVVHSEKYQNYSDHDIRSIYAEKERTGFERYMKNPELARSVEELGLKNLAQIYTQAKYTRESHINYSKSVLNFIKEQNFFEF